MWPQAREVGRVSRPLQDNRQLLDALCERLWRLQLEQKIEEETEALKENEREMNSSRCYCPPEACHTHGGGAGASVNGKHNDSLVLMTGKCVMLVPCQ